MAYTLTIVVLLVTVVVGSNVLGVPVTGNNHHETCVAELWSYDSYPCYRTVWIDGACDSSTLNLAHTSISQCSAFHLSWSNPVENLTMTIETPFTEKQQAYAIFIDNEGMMGPVSHVYRLIDNKEIEVTTTSKKLVQYSDSNYQVTLKFQSPSEFTYYGVFIDFVVVQI